MEVTYDDPEGALIAGGGKSLMFQRPKGSRAARLAANPVTVDSRQLAWASAGVCLLPVSWSRQRAVGPYVCERGDEFAADERSLLL
jgi:hypothetical protein